MGTPASVPASGNDWALAPRSSCGPPGSNGWLARHSTACTISNGQSVVAKRYACEAGGSAHFIRLHADQLSCRLPHSLQNPQLARLVATSAAATEWVEGSPATPTGPFSTARNWLAQPPLHPGSPAPAMLGRRRHRAEGPFRQRGCWPTLPRRVAPERAAAGPALPARQLGRCSRTWGCSPTARVHRPPGWTAETPNSPLPQFERTGEQPDRREPAVGQTSQEGRSELPEKCVLRLCCAAQRGGLGGAAQRGGLGGAAQRGGVDGAAQRGRQQARGICGRQQAQPSVEGLTSYASARPESGPAISMRMVGPSRKPSSWAHQPRSASAGPACKTGRVGKRGLARRARS